MSSESGFPENVARLLKQCSETVAAVLSQALAVGVEVAGEAKEGATVAGFRAAFRAAGDVDGRMSFSLGAGDAVFLARTFTGASMEEATEPGAEDREALDELWRQVMGELATRLRPVAGEVRFELLPAMESAEDAPRTPVAALMVFTCQGRTMPLGVTLAGGLAQGIVGVEADADSDEEMEAAAAPLAGEIAGGPAIEGLCAAFASLRPENLELLLNVELPATLRFGQKQMRLSDILQLSAGAVIDLDREVQEPVELLVDGRLIARGEAVIVDGNYGLRVTELATPTERLTVIS